MRTLSIWLLTIFLTSLCRTECVANDPAVVLIEELQGAEAGDFVVTKQARTYTVLLVRSRTPQRLVLEEITASERCGKPRRMTWKQWVEQGAPNHTSWIAYAVNASSGRVLDSYSYSRGSWLNAGHTDHFLTTLLTLSFRAVPDERRRRVGSFPWGSNEKANFWTPKLVYEGRIYQDIVFNAWEATWPRDGSPLSGKEVTIYLPEPESRFPRYFPYWLEVTPAPGDNTVRVVDSGHALSSPKQELVELRPQTQIAT